VILILFLIRPLGFSGKRLKKVEVSAGKNPQTFRIDRVWGISYSSRHGQSNTKKARVGKACPLCWEERRVRFVFLIARPLGFSGKRLKKVDV